MTDAEFTKKGKELEQGYERKTGKPWPFLIPGETMLRMGTDKEFGKFMLNIVGPSIRKGLKHKK
jgi:hypothetical protein